MKAGNDEHADFSREEWEACLKVLRALAKDPFAAPEPEMFKGLVKKVYTRAKKQLRREAREARKSRDGQRLAGTARHRADPRTVNTEDRPPEADAQPRPYVRLETPRNCYICKKKFAELHFFYHALCPACAEFNYAQRGNRADLRGRTALLTGGRLKIGFELGLKLLRDGARLIVTTRFPKDAALRYAEQPDAADWSGRLRIRRLDLRDLPAVEAFIAGLLHELPQLDILIHNAAQTIRRPPDFYRHLLEREAEPLNNLPAPARTLLSPSTGPAVIPRKIPQNPLFPAGQFDNEGRQLDLRPANSWTMPLEAVGTVELLEVQLVNSIAPFLFNSKLKPLFLRSSHKRKFIVNVSAVEGQFNRGNKTEFHPHTNMAKAALNMMTRTSARGYAADGIYMTAVDTGWVTQENPREKAVRMREKGFVPPLDVVDGAARVYDPIVRGLEDRAEPLSGVFLKDYRIAEW